MGSADQPPRIGLREVDAAQPKGHRNAVVNPGLGKSDGRCRTEQSPNPQPSILVPKESTQNLCVYKGGRFYSCQERPTIRVLAFAPITLLCLEGAGLQPMGSESRQKMQDCVPQVPLVPQTE